MSLNEPNYGLDATHMELLCSCTYILYRKITLT